MADVTVDVRDNLLFSVNYTKTHLELANGTLVVQDRSAYGKIGIPSTLPGYAPTDLWDTDLNGIHLSDSGAYIDFGPVVHITNQILARGPLSVIAVARPGNGHNVFGSIGSGNGFVLVTRDHVSTGVYGLGAYAGTSAARGASAIVSPASIAKRAFGFTYLLGSIPHDVTGYVDGFEVTNLVSATDADSASIPDDGQGNHLLVGAYYRHVDGVVTLGNSVSLGTGTNATSDAVAYITDIYSEKLTPSEIAELMTLALEDTP